MRARLVETPLFDFVRSQIVAGKKSPSEMGPKNTDLRSLCDRLGIDEPNALESVVAGLKGELQYLNDPAQKVRTADWEKNLLPLSWLSAPGDADVARWERRFCATQPDSPCPIFSVAFNSLGASMPAANRHFSESVSCWYRKSAEPDHETIFDSFDEMSAIVSDTPRLVPIDWAIS